MPGQKQPIATDCSLVPWSQRHAMICRPIMEDFLVFWCDSGRSTDDGWPISCSIFRREPGLAGNDPHILSVSLCHPFFLYLPLSSHLSLSLSCIADSSIVGRLYFGIGLQYQTGLPLWDGASPKPAIPWTRYRSLIGRSPTTDTIDPLCPVSEKYGHTSRIIYGVHTRVYSIIEYGIKKDNTKLIGVHISSE